MTDDKEAEMKRWKRLAVDPGTSKGGYDVLVQNVRSGIEDAVDYPDLPAEWDQQATITFLCADYTLVGILGHLEYPHPFGADVASYVERAAGVAVDYFYGDWRDGYQYLSDNGYRKLTPPQCRKKLDWIETYREGVMCALCLDLEESLERIAAWPDTDLPFDDGTYRLTEEDNKYHIVLARCLRGEPLSKSSRLVNAIRQGKRRRPKLLLATLEAAMAEDSAAFDEKLTRWLQTFRRTEFKPQKVWLVFSIEGTILWHVARHRGLNLPELPTELADLVVTRDTVQRR